MDDWRVFNARKVADHTIFEVHRHDAENPRNGRKGSYTLLHAPDWVQVVAVTPDGRVVLVRQFRHGVGAVTLEVPGGVVDPGETPLQSAVRELREETGYETGRWEPLGSLMPNPAFMDNRLHAFLAIDAVPTSGVELDDGEDIEIVTPAVDEIPELIANGRIGHALVVATLGLFRERVGGWQPPSGAASDR